MHMVRPEIARRKPLSLMYLGSAALGHAFQDDTCHGEASRMGQRQGDPRRAHARGDFCGASVELDAGTSTGFADDFDLQPAHAMADTGSQGFRSRSDRSSIVISQIFPSLPAGAGIARFRPWLVK